MPKVGSFWFLACITPLVGCQDREHELRAWQQEQVAQMQRQAHEHSAAARALVEADAESRRQFVALEQAVQAERESLSEGHAALEADRRAVTDARERVPLFATAFDGVAAFALGIAALLICGRLLSRTAADDGAAELEETLVLSLAGESDLLAEPAVYLPSTSKARPPAAEGEPSALTRDSSHFTERN